MLRAWAGPRRPLVSDPHSRITAENAAHAAALARALRVQEVVVVTSRWHRLRTWLLFRAVLRGSGARLEIEAASGPSSLRLVLRELVSLPLVPLQLVLVAGGAGRSAADSRAEAAT